MASNGKNPLGSGRESSQKVNPHGRKNEPPKSLRLASSNRPKRLSPRKKRQPPRVLPAVNTDSTDSSPTRNPLREAMGVRHSSVQSLDQASSSDARVECAVDFENEIRSEDSTSDDTTLPKIKQNESRVENLHPNLAQDQPVCASPLSCTAHANNDGYNEITLSHPDLEANQKRLLQYDPTEEIREGIETVFVEIIQTRKTRTPRSSLMDTDTSTSQQERGDVLSGATCRTHVVDVHTGNPHRTESVNANEDCIQSDSQGSIPEKDDGPEIRHNSYTSLSALQNHEYLKSKRAKCDQNIAVQVSKANQCVCSAAANITEKKYDLRNSSFPKVVRHTGTDTSTSSSPRTYPTNTDIQGLAVGPILKQPVEVITDEEQTRNYYKNAIRKSSICTTASNSNESSEEYQGASQKRPSSDEAVTSNDSHCHSLIVKSAPDRKAKRKLILASVLCLLFMAGETAGGLIAGSLAIISDAAHLLTDFASFMISLAALYLAQRPATKKLSFGWYRIEILGALLSILMLWVLTGILVYSAAERITTGDYEINAKVMLITAATGVAFNILLGTTLHQHTHSHGGGHGHSHGDKGHGHSHSGQGHSKRHRQSLVESQLLNNGQHTQEAGPYVTTNSSHPQSKPSTSSSYYGAVDATGAKAFPDNDPESDQETAALLRPRSTSGSSSSDVEGQHEGHHNHESNINVKAAFIHVVGDLFQSIGVLIAAFVIYFKPEWKIADPICTFLFSLFVLVTTITILRDILLVLMEGTPRGINFAEVREAFFQVEGVLDIHNLRVWSLTMDKIALSVHIAVDKASDPHAVLKRASNVIQKRFAISETTMQIEEYVTEMDDCVDCKGPKL